LNATTIDNNTSVDNLTTEWIVTDDVNDTVVSWTWLNTNVALWPDWNYTAKLTVEDEAGNISKKTFDILENNTTYSLPVLPTITFWDDKTVEDLEVLFQWSDKTLDINYRNVEPWAVFTLSNSQFVGWSIQNWGGFDINSSTGVIRYNWNIEPSNAKTTLTVWVTNPWWQTVYKDVNITVLNND